LSQRRNIFALLQPIHDHSKSQRLHARHGFLSSLSIGHHAWKVEELTNPTAVLLAVNFDEKIHRLTDP
jgi:hypothetical protein